MKLPELEPGYEEAVRQQYRLNAERNPTHTEQEMWDMHERIRQLEAQQNNERVTILPISKGIIRAYHISHKAWYNESRLSNDPSMSFGLYDENGEGCEAEMLMKWVQLGQDPLPSPMLKCFSDSFAVLYSFHDVLEELAVLNDKAFTPEEFKQLLDKCGFTDMTDYSAGLRPRRRAFIEGQTIPTIE